MKMLKSEGCWDQGNITEDWQSLFRHKTTNCLKTGESYVNVTT